MFVCVCMHARVYVCMYECMHVSRYVSKSNHQQAPHDVGPLFFGALLQSYSLLMKTMTIRLFSKRDLT